MVLDSELLSYVHITSVGLRTNNLGSILDSFHNVLELRMRESTEVAAAVHSMGPKQYLCLLPGAVLSNCLLTHDQPAGLPYATRGGFVYHFFLIEI